MQEITIGTLSKTCNVSTDTLRYYEKMKLLQSCGRTSSGYRLYNADSIQTLRFILGAKALNFTLEEISDLLQLRSSNKSDCGEILKRTQRKIADAEAKIQELKEVQKVLMRLIEECPGDETPLSCCPILKHIQNANSVLLALGLSLTFAFPANAKPISYVGGTMIMQENDETGSTVTMDYTVTPNYALGFYAKREAGGDDYYTVGPQINTLIKRWNLPNGQGNIFNMTGAGVSHDSDENEASIWTSFLADYETRRIFVSYEPRFMYAGDIDQSFSQRARVGVAPYLANYDDLNTWLMVQVDHHPTKEDNVVVTPLVRLFYKTTLMEAGYSSNDKVMFNWRLQF